MRRPGAVAVAVVVALVPLVLSGCARTQPAAQTSTTPSPPPTPAASTPTPEPTSSSPSPGPSEPAETTMRVPVYWAGDTSQGVRLYREFLDGSGAPGSAGRVEAALEVMVAGRADDPDFRSLWPPTTTVEAVDVAGDTITVDLSGPLTAQARDAGSLDVQQLVHTVTASAPGTSLVAINVEGAPLLPEPVARAPHLEVLAAVWIIDPQNGVATGRPLRLSGSASVFEATVSWEVRRGGAVVRSGIATATEGAPGRGTWRRTIRGLTPGTYRVVAWETSMEDGRRMSVDDKTVTLG